MYDILISSKEFDNDFGYITNSNVFCENKNIYNLPS